MNVRAFLLVKNDNAFCSSATGEMHVPMKDLLPEIDLNKDFDMVILHGTPMMPDKPAIAMWFRSPCLMTAAFLSHSMLTSPLSCFIPHSNKN
jgi:hypothetical protein